MNLYTWNIQGLHTKQQEVLKELEDLEVNICVLTETKKKGNGSEIHGNFIHIYSGRDKSERARGGVSILIRKSFKKYIKEWKCIDEWILMVSLILYGYEIEIVGIYASNEDASVATKEVFFEEVKQIIGSINARKTIILLGDMNGRTGTEMDNEIVGRIQERYWKQMDRRLRTK